MPGTSTPDGLVAGTSGTYCLDYQNRRATMSRLGSTMVDWSVAEKNLARRNFPPSSAANLLVGCTYIADSRDAVNLAVVR
jgi:hypothetical protein